MAQMTVGPSSRDYIPDDEPLQSARYRVATAAETCDRVTAMERHVRKTA